MDPTGNHLVIALTDDVQYIHKTAQKPKAIAKVKGNISVVAWEQSPQEMSCNFLAGTSLGQVYEYGVGRYPIAAAQTDLENTSPTKHSSR